MEGFVFNTRRPLFADVRVREALGLLFDFEWINRNYFFDLYRRTGSYFDGSELSARGRPADPRERELLAGYPNAVRSDVVAGTWTPPVTDGSGRDRETLKRALALLSAAGYELKGTELRERASGRPLAFEILVATRDKERLALAFARDLKRAGIAVKVRQLDATDYQQRLQTFDYDMIIYRWDQSLSPGNEQSFYFGAAAADAEGSRNYMGAKNPAIDAMIGAMLQAVDRADFVSAVHALDRVLISGCYVVPLFHTPDQWIARWAQIERPAKTSLFGYLPETWWHRPPAQGGHGQVILGATNMDGGPAMAHVGAATIDDLFRRVVAARPNAPALIDPPDRASFTDGAPRRLTWAEADRVVSAIANLLRSLALPPG